MFEVVHQKVENRNYFSTVQSAGIDEILITMSGFNLCIHS